VRSERHCEPIRAATVRERSRFSAGLGTGDWGLGTGDWDEGRPASGLGSWPAARDGGTGDSGLGNGKATTEAGCHGCAVQQPCLVPRQARLHTAQPWHPRAGGRPIAPFGGSGGRVAIRSQGRAPGFSLSPPAGARRREERGGGGGGPRSPGLPPGLQTRRPLQGLRQRPATVAKAARPCRRSSGTQVLRYSGTGVFPLADPSRAVTMVAWAGPGRSDAWCWAAAETGEGGRI